MKTENGVLKSDVADLKKEALNQQIHKSKKSVIIRAFPQKNLGKESLLQLRNQYEEVLKELNPKQAGVFRPSKGRGGEESARICY